MKFKEILPIISVLVTSLFLFGCVNFPIANNGVCEVNEPINSSDCAYEEFCQKNIDKELSEFKLNLEDSANYKNSNAFRFDNPNNCFDESDAIIKIERIIENPKLCSIVCGIATNNCYIFNFVISKSEIIKQKCLNISQYTDFIEDGCDASSNELVGYETIYPEFNIPIGDYVINNLAKSEEVYPKICIYHKK